MADDLLASALSRSARRELSVMELFRCAEALKRDVGASAAEALYAVWSQHNQDDPLLYTVLFNYAVTLTESSRLHPARELLERAIALNPDFMPAYINLGRVNEQLGAGGQALTQWSRALARMAGVNGPAITYKTTTLNQMARTLETAHEDEHAAELLHQSLELDGTQREVAQHLVAVRQRQCAWPVIAPWERVPRELLITSMSPLSAAIYADDPVLQMGVSWIYNCRDVGHPAAPMAIPPATATGTERLRIGYLSSDLREHSVGHLMAEVFDLHDSARVEVFAYYCGIPVEDALHEKFKRTADHFLNITDMSDAAAAQRMVEDGIQILVDLNGYTRDGRTRLVALRPAPVIVNWLGYPGTTASPYHHFIVADDWIIPPDHELYYTEQVLRLPCYQPSNRHRVVAPRCGSRADAGLPKNATVFCCFNGTQKITKFWFERWMTILDQVPGSVLWLLTGTNATNDRLLAQAASRGIAAERIVFAERLGNADHLARYRLADLFLDTFPYGAHTTGSDALWMGVPVLTLSGRSFASRVCGSLVRAAGLPELVCATADDYVARAIALGREKAKLRALRDRLVAGRDSCALFDVPYLVRGLEGLYAGMWRAFTEDRLPRPDLANLDVYLEVAATVDRESLDVSTIADFHGWWRDQLARRHCVRPIAEDRRLFSSRDTFPPLAPDVPAPDPTPAVRAEATADSSSPALAPVKRGRAPRGSRKAFGPSTPAPEMISNGRNRDSPASSAAEGR